jgi:hypothetical protein
MEQTTAQKDALFEQVQGRMRRWYGTTMESSGMSCLYYMHAGLVTLERAGIYCIPAAGTAKWQKEADTGSNDTHFAFEWAGGEGDLRAALLPDGKKPMPEMHCWCWLPESQEVVDFSAGFVPELARVLGFQWQQPLLPPRYIWARPKSLFPRSVYWPNRDATKVAIAMLMASRKGIQ